MAGWLCLAIKDKMVERCSSILQDHLILIKLESTYANTTLAETKEFSMIQGHNSSSSFSSATPPTTQLTGGADPARSSSKTTGITGATQFVLEMFQMQGELKQEFQE